MIKKNILKKRKGFSYGLLSVTVLLASFATINMLSYFKILTINSNIEFKQEANSFIKSEMANMKDYCPEDNESDSVDNYEYQKDWNYGLKNSYKVSCHYNEETDDDTGEILKYVVFDFEGCRNKNRNDKDLICKDYSGKYLIP